MSASDPDSDADAQPGPGAGESPPRPPSPILLSRARAEPPPPPPARPIPLDTVAATRSARPAAPVTPATPLAPATCDAVLAQGVVYTGAVLKQAREDRGLSLEQVCERTRIPRQHVLNLEGDRYDQLPAPVYLRGMLMALAKELRLDGQKVSRSYLEALAAALRERAR